MVMEADKQDDVLVVTPLSVEAYHDKEPNLVDTTSPGFILLPNRYKLSLDIHMLSRWS